MVDIDLQKKQEAVDRFVSLAGLSPSAAEALVEAALQAAVNQTLDTMMGSGPVPSAMTAIRVDNLRYVCLQAAFLPSARSVSCSERRQRARDPSS